MKYGLELLPAASSRDARTRAASSSRCFSDDGLIGNSITTPSTGCGTIAKAQSSVLYTSVNLTVGGGKGSVDLRIGSSPFGET